MFTLNPAQRQSLHEATRSLATNHLNPSIAPNRLIVSVQLSFSLYSETALLRLRSSTERQTGPAIPPCAAQLWSLWTIYERSKEIRALFQLGLRMKTQSLSRFAHPCQRHCPVITNAAVRYLGSTIAISGVMLAKACARCGAAQRSRPRSESLDAHSYRSWSRAGELGSGL